MKPQPKISQQTPTADPPGANRLALAREYQNLYGKPPPLRISCSILVMAIAYRTQEAALGGLKPSLRRRLLVHAPVDTNTSPTSPICAIRSIKPGTVLLREWQGVTYTVQIIEEGVVFQGNTYRSLSQVARRITGQHWSGPRFFGLLSQKIEQKSEVTSSGHEARP